MFWAGGGGVASQSKIFHPFGAIPIAGEGLQILTYAQHFWPLSSEGSLACHTYYDTGHPFIMVISEDPWHSHLMSSVWQWSCYYLFKDFDLSRLGFEHQTFCLQDERSNPLRHHRGFMNMNFEWRGWSQVWNFLIECRIYTHCNALSPLRLF